MKRTPLKRGKPPQRKTRVKAKNAKRKGSRFPHRRDPEYREWIRSLPCTVEASAWANRCDDVIECAHVRTRGAGGDDRGNTVPLCRWHHRQQHRIGIRSFESVYRLDLAVIARNLGERYTPTEAEW